MALLFFFFVFCFCFFFVFFFFQAEDGIRDIGVTGVQTCALPIYSDLPQISVLNLMLSKRSVGNNVTDILSSRYQILCENYYELAT